MCDKLLENLLKGTENDVDFKTLFQNLDHHNAKTNHDKYYWLINNHRIYEKDYLKKYENLVLNKKTELHKLTREFHELKNKHTNTKYQKSIVGNLNLLNDLDKEQKPAEYDKLISNFLHFTINNNIKSNRRITANIQPKNLYEFAEGLVEIFKKDEYKKFISSFKVSTPGGSIYRSDPIVIYFTNNEDDKATEKIIEAIKNINKTKDIDPIKSHPNYMITLNKSFGFGSQPDIGSFSSKRAYLAEIAHNIGSNPEEASTILSALFRMSGISPEEPWKDNKYNTDILKDITIKLKDRYK
ncbi:MAG: hypothetical protein N4A72_07455 [Bacteroidales bacterium]|nr:hypothetical protein [Bacteroidales bacterium]